MLVSSYTMGMICELLNEEKYVTKSLKVSVLLKASGAFAGNFSWAEISHHLLLSFLLIQVKAKSDSSSKRIHSVFKEAIRMLQEKGVVFQKPSSSKDLYHVRNWAGVANKFRGVTFIVSRNSRNVSKRESAHPSAVCLLESYLQLTWLLLLPLYHALSSSFCNSAPDLSTAVVPSAVCVPWVAKLRADTAEHAAGWDSSLYRSGLKLDVLLSWSPSFGLNAVISCSSPNSWMLLMVLKITEGLTFVINLGGSI